MKMSRIGVLSVLAMVSGQVFANNISVNHQVSKLYSVEDKSVNRSEENILLEELMKVEVPAMPKTKVTVERVLTPEQKAALVDLKLSVSTK